MFKRILAVVVMVISVIVLIASIAGIIGVWAVNTPLTESLLDVFVPIDRAYVRFEEGLEKVDTRLSETREKLSDIEAKIQTLGDTVTENTIVLDAIEERFDIDLECIFSNFRVRRPSH